MILTWILRMYVLGTWNMKFENLFLKTPIHFAARNGHTEFVQSLLNADLNAKNISCVRQKRMRWWRWEKSKRECEMGMEGKEEIGISDFFLVWGAVLWNIHFSNRKLYIHICCILGYVHLHSSDGFHGWTGGILWKFQLYIWN